MFAMQIIEEPLHALSAIIHVSIAIRILQSCNLIYLLVMAY